MKEFDQRSSSDQSEMVDNESGYQGVSASDFKQKNPQKKISSTLFDVAFLTHKHTISVDENLFLNLTPEDIRLIATGQKPWAETIVEKPYWVDGSKYWEGGQAHYTKLKMGIFNSIPTTDDRHILDACIAYGEPIDKDTINHKTLRDVLWGWEDFVQKREKKKATSESDDRDDAYKKTHLPQCIPFDNLSLNVKGTYSNLDDNSMFRRKYQYIFVNLAEITRLQGQRTCLSNKNKTLEALQRLTNTKFRITPSTSDYFDMDKAIDIDLLDDQIIAFCDLNSCQNRKNVSPKTKTHIIIGISRAYHDSLARDASIPRDILMQRYIGLKNKANRVDFMKYLESNADGFFAGYDLNKVIQKYMDNKVKIIGFEENPNTETKRKYKLKKALTEEALKDGFSAKLRELTGYYFVQVSPFKHKIQYAPVNGSQTLFTNPKNDL